jgi:hypothetical protein
VLLRPLRDSYTAINPQLATQSWISASRSPRSIRTLTDCEGFLEALRASTVMRVLICSSVRRALSRTSVEGTEVVRRGIGSGTTAHSVPTGTHPELCENRITGKNQSSRREWAEVNRPSDRLSDLRHPLRHR